MSSYCKTCGTPEPDDPCFDCGSTRSAVVMSDSRIVNPTHADAREAAALRFPPPPVEFLRDRTL